MLLHGILAGYNETLDQLIHEMRKISQFDAEKVPKKISWKKTRVFDNSNKGRKIGEYKEKCNND